MAEAKPAGLAPIPDRDTAGYWAQLSEGKFVVQRCSDCDRWTWPARPLCSNCHGERLEWSEPGGTGEVYSWVVTYQPYGPEFVDAVPYTTAWVKLDEQADILIPGQFPSDVQIFQGQPVRATTEHISADVGILLWTPMAGREPDVLA